MEINYLLNIILSDALKSILRAIFYYIYNKNQTYTFSDDNFFTYIVKIDFWTSQSLKMISYAIHVWYNIFVNLLMLTEVLIQQ